MAVVGFRIFSLWSCMNTHIPRFLPCMEIIFWKSFWYCITLLWMSVADSCKSSIFRRWKIECGKNCWVQWIYRHWYLFKSTIFWDITPCSPLSVNWLFGGTYYLHLQGRRNEFNKKPAIIQVASCHHRNIGWHSMDYTALYPRRWYSS
jgi:hypothetical protein